MLKLQRLTSSRLSAFRRCQRLHQLRYDLGWRAIADTAALRFGTHVHRGLEWWWRALLPAGPDEAIAALHLEALELGLDPQQLVAHTLPEQVDPSLLDALAPFEAALLALRTPALRDPIEQLQAEEMIFGYHLRWSGAALRPYDVELRFAAPLRDPDSGSTSRVWEQAGKLDVMAYGQLEGLDVGHLVVEHKTTVSDISVGSPYWKRLRMNGQVSIYLDGARSLGYEPLACLYDVLAKPKLRLKEGEHLEAFRLRLRAEITGDLERYFARHPIARLEAETEEHARDVWTFSRQIRAGQCANRRAPRNADACTDFGSLCEFHALCSGTALHRLEDDARFERLEDPHPELAITTTDEF